MPMDNNTNKLINNGYLRTPYITKNNGHGTVTSAAPITNTVIGNTNNRTNNADDDRGGGVEANDVGTINDNEAATVVSPLLGAENKSELSETEVMHHLSTSPTPPQQHQQQQQPPPSIISCANNVGHMKFPTVVYLGSDSGKILTGVGSNTNIARTTTTTTTTIPTLQHNAPPVSYNISTHSPSHHSASHQSEWLLKESTLRCRLLVLAVALTVLGAAIGALAIYFAGNYRCQTITQTLDKSRNINNNNSNNNNHNTTGFIHDRDDICLTEECVRTAAYLLSAMDTSVDPCENFFQYACGTWNKVHIIPEDRSSISTYEVLDDQLQVILKGVLEEPINDMDNQATIKAKTFYKSCIDIPQIRKIGEGRLKNVLKSLGGWPVIETDWKTPNTSIEKLIGTLRGTYGEPVLIELYVGADDKNSSSHVLQIDQFPLALPSRDYYLKASSDHYLKAYHRYMTQTAILMGANSATAAEELNDVLQLEVKLVNATLPEADRHDTSAIYRKINLKELQAEVPQLNWTLFLQAVLGSDIVLKENEELVSYAMPYLVDMGKIVKETDERVLHNYVLWRLVMSIMTHMIDDYQKERVEFRKILLGIQTERVRWSQCVDWTNKKLGMAVGTLFIRDNFNQKSKDTALEMIHTIREAFNELLSENHWMDDETRAVAKEKADTMNERIGYPEFLTDAKELEKEYVNLTIVADNFMENILSILKWESEKNMQLLRQPVDKEKWTTEPAIVNAFYNPNKNDIVFPAGILQPLFYSQHFPKSLNYGGIGVVIGHEITHGFDDKGRQFDKDGNMMQWWNNATIEAFRERAQCIIDQYSKYKIDEVGLFMNGRMTQGENIADNGGLKQAFRAYKKWVQRYGPEQSLPGLNLTHNQLFFLNYAQIWCGTMRPEDALTKIRSAVHSPGSIRVLGPLSNSKDFAEAFQCELGSPMNPVEKCSVW